MKKNWLRLTAVVLLLCLVPLTALAERAYLIPDSDRRKLTRDELWTWDYESLGYILNEIFARHGYNFEAGGRYDAYFSCMPWYKPNDNPNNKQACYPKMNSTEWYNERLVKDVRQEMRNLNTTNKGGKSVWDGFSTGFDTLSGFEYIELKKGQKLKVYSAPDVTSWRGGNGKAAISTNGYVYAAGWENGWLMVMYETNNGSVRVGYVNGSDIRGSVPMSERLQFEYLTSTVTGGAVLTDDPARTGTSIRSLTVGEKVTYLTTLFNRQSWDYVETTINGQTVRGFIPTGCLDISQSDADSEPEENG